VSFFGLSPEIEDRDEVESVDNLLLVNNIKKRRGPKRLSCGTPLPIIIIVYSINS
jgi:hypothetical protein